MSIRAHAIKAHACRELTPSTEPALLLLLRFSLHTRGSATASAKVQFRPEAANKLQACPNRGRQSNPVTDL
jgi:hypothetical protein